MGPGEALIHVEKLRFSESRELQESSDAHLLIGSAGKEVLAIVCTRDRTVC